jgi:hypothetical protein
LDLLALLKGKGTDVFAFLAIQGKANPHNTGEMPQIPKNTPYSQANVPFSQENTPVSYGNHRDFRENNTSVAKQP